MMKNVFVDFGKTMGEVKPLHAVNNGPVYKFAEDQRITNIEAYKEAGIPYARNHDASFFSTYGGEHTVDITAIFPDFDADPYQEASYDFACTDEYIRVTELANCRTFYRLGQKIEHTIKKYGTIPPKDFQKWAVICEHIIKHYCYGWADGFHYDIRYWEIWNEADLDDDDATHKRTWGGTKLQFFELYNVAAKHLKACFPELKIGGPALAGREDWAEDFLKQLDAPLDFFSWHKYAKDPQIILEKAERMRKLLDENGYEKTESILNEWNYVRGWLGDDFLYSLRKIKELKASAFIAGTMAVSQKVGLDMLMYYDARPCGFNGMFSTDFVCDTLKGYYPFWMFNKLYQLGTAVPAESDAPHIYAVAAKNDTKAAMMVTHFQDDDDAKAEKVCLGLAGLNNAKKIKISYYLLDETHDATLVKEEIRIPKKQEIKLQLPNFTTYLIVLESVK